MKKAIVLLPIVSALTACGTTSSFDKRADQARERQEKYVERSLDKAPDWMTKTPPNTANVVYASATSVSGDMAMADEKAKIIAMSKICTAAGGEVDKQSKVYNLDTESSTQERSEMAIRSMCRKVDVTGVEVVELKRITQGARYRTYVLVALPMGDANTLKQEKTNLRLERETADRAKEAFKELDAVVPAQ
jgi:hypothetical protein